MRDIIMIACHEQQDGNNLFPLEEVGALVNDMRATLPGRLLAEKDLDHFCFLLQMIRFDHGLAAAIQFFTQDRQELNGQSYHAYFAREFNPDQLARIAGVMPLDLAIAQHPNVLPPLPAAPARPRHRNANLNAGALRAPRARRQLNFFDGPNVNPAPNLEANNHRRHNPYGRP